MRKELIQSDCDCSASCYNERVSRSLCVNWSGYSECEGVWLFGLEPRVNI